MQQYWLLLLKQHCSNGSSEQLSITSTSFILFDGWWCFLIAHVESYRSSTQGLDMGLDVVSLQSDISPPPSDGRRRAPGLTSKAAESLIRRGNSRC